MTEPDNRIIEEYVKNYPRQVIELIEGHPHAEAAALLSSLPANVAAKIVEELVPFKAVKSLELLDDPVLTKVFAELPTKRISGLLLRFNESKQKQILKGLPKLKRDAIGSQWQYPIDSVGGQMDMDLNFSYWSGDRRVSGGNKKRYRTYPVPDLCARQKW